MNQNKLITLFKTLSTKEVRQFGCFLKGASYRENSITFRLYKYLKKKHPSFPDKKISKTVLFEEIMPKDESANQRYSDKDKAKRVTDEMSILTKNLEKFLPILVLQHEEVKKDFLILSFLKQRKQDKLFFQKINQIQKKWQKSPPSGVNHYYYQYELSKMHFYHPSSSLYCDSPIGLRDIMKKMDEFYFASKLYCASCLYNNEQLLVHNKQPEPIVLLYEIQEFLEYPSLKKNLHIDLFHKILTAFLKEESPDFTKIKTLYFDNIERFNDAEKSDLFMFLLRFFKEQFIKGHNSYLREIFDLYKAGIEKEIIIEDGSIAQDIFRDIVLIGCSVKEFQWTKLFIEIYKDYLAEQHRNSIVSLCKSILFFNQGNFLEALQMLNVLKDDDVFAKLQITYIQLQCYYELDYYDAFFSLTNSFSTYLCRDKKLAQPIKKSALNFTNIIKNLYNYRNTCTENFEQLKSKIEAINYIANKNWLLEKIEASIK